MKYITLSTLKFGPQNNPLQWNLSITHTVGFVPYSLTQGLPVGYISGRRGMRNRVVEHNMAVFSAFHWQGEVSSTSNSANAKSGSFAYN